MGGASGGCTTRGAYPAAYLLFASDHAAMRGAPARAIQELAGHADLSTMQRYRHLSPAAKESAIRLLDRSDGGEIGETKKGVVN